MSYYNDGGGHGHGGGGGGGGGGGKARRNKLDEVAGSAGPASSNGGPVDLAKKARREAAIKRYKYKRGRRKFANSTRDASPSRSRPKAAKIRPRLHGKFVKVVPDFIPVTAVSTDGGVGDMDVKMGELLRGSGNDGMRGREGVGGGVGGGGGRAKGDDHSSFSGVKRETRGLRGVAGAGGVRQQRSSFQQQQQQQSASKSHGGGFASLWHTPPPM